MTTRRIRESGVAYCPCCGDHMMTSDIHNPGLCGNCLQAGCEMTADATGERAYWECQRDDDDADDDASSEAREITAQQIAVTPPGRPVPARYTLEAERQLRAAGRCWFQTGYGLSGFEYCGHPAPPGQEPDEPGSDEQSWTWGMCARHARQAAGIEDPDIRVGDLVYDPDPGVDPGHHGTVTYADSNGYRVRWDGQDEPWETGYGDIEPVPGSPSPGVRAAQRLEAAVRADHPCSDRSCDISAALEAGCPQTAAWLLSQATGEHPELTRLLAKGDAILPVYFADCDDWAQWESFHRRHGRRCPGCGSFTYGDEQTEPDPCASCLAPLPANSTGPRSDDGSTTLDGLNTGLDEWADTGEAMRWRPQQALPPDPIGGRVLIISQAPRASMQAADIQTARQGAATELRHLQAAISGGEQYANDLLAGGMSNDHATLQAVAAAQEATQRAAAAWRQVLAGLAQHTAGEEYATSGIAARTGFLKH